MLIRPKSSRSRHASASIAPPRPSLGGAAAAQAGYDYQLGVSILAALQLLLVSRSASQIILEPCNDEDLEVDLVEDRPGRVCSSANLSPSGYRLVIQVKMRNGEPWSLRDVKALLNHGIDRKPAKHHLDDENTYFLLVTNAAAKGSARNLLVEDFTEKADANAFPSSLRAILPTKPEGRLAILANLTPAMLKFETDRILGKILHVPLPRQDDCLGDLRSEAKRRMSGTTPGIWTREDLHGVIRRHDGYLASIAALEAFVPPENFPELKSKLTSRNAVIIHGPSGAGKTYAAQKLCAEIRNSDGRTELVTITASESPNLARRQTSAGPVLFYIDDPWGQYSLTEGASAWSAQLPRILAHASPDQRYIVTTRSDLLSQPAIDALAAWLVALDAENYRNGALEEIYDKRVAILPNHVQAFAFEYKSDVLKSLETPLELDLFFTALAESNPVSMNYGFLRDLLALAHRDAVAGVVHTYLNELDKKLQAPLIWAMLVGRGALDRQHLVSVMRRLRRVSPNLGDGLISLVDRLTATRHLKQPIHSISFAHPSVREGFEAYLTANWFDCEASLANLLEALVDLPATDQQWGLETAARTLKAIYDLHRTLGDLAPPFELDAGHQRAIDEWLEAGLLSEGGEFERLVYLAAEVGGSQSPSIAVARWLVNGVQRGAAFFMDDWTAPQHDDAWYEWVAADPRSFTIANRFVRDILPNDRGSYDLSFVDKINRIATGLTPAFQAAARYLVGAGHESNISTIAYGALQNLQTFEPVLTAVLDDLKEEAVANRSTGGIDWRALEDGELDTAFDYYLEGDDSGYCSEALLHQYVKAKRHAGDWRGLAGHARAPELAEAWADTLHRAKKPAPIEEVQAVLDLTLQSNCQSEGWNAVSHNWHAELAPRLSDQLSNAPEEQQLRDALTQCAVMHAPSIFSDILARSNGEPGITVHLLRDIAAAIRACNLVDGPLDLRWLKTGFRDEHHNIVDALLLPLTPLTDVELALLEEAAETVPVRVLEDIVPLLRINGAKRSRPIARWLRETSDKNSAVAAAEEAVRSGDTALIWQALTHARADARLVALHALLEMLPNPLPARLLHLATDKGSRVRLALAKALAERPHPDHLPTLLSLTRDGWNDAEPQHNEPDSFPIARQAAKGVRNFPSVSASECDSLIDIALKTSDVGLTCEAFSTAADMGEPEHRRQIWRLSRNKELHWTRVFALEGLTNARAVEEDIVTQLTSTMLLRDPPPLAIAALPFLCRHSSVENGMKIFEQLGKSSSHRSLVLVAACWLEDKDRDAALSLLNFLPADNPGRRLLEAGYPKLPRSLLDELGDVRVRSYVAKFFKNRLS